MNLQYWSFSENYIYGDNSVVALHIATETSSTNNMQLSTYEIERARGEQSRQAMQTRQCGGISADLTFLLLFWSSKKAEEENMNGRLYDPVIARFFSPDKYVANSSFTQDFNRYSYARNCPLMYTDPSGEFLWWIPIAAIGISAAISAASYTIDVAASQGGFQNWNWDAFGANMMLGIGKGIATSAIGGAFGAVGSLGALGEIGRAGAHAVVGGMFSEATGGNFWTGAATSFASSLVGSATAGLPWYGQIGASTLTGGVISKLTGGTFWQGAVNGFMVSALNHAAEGIENAIIRNYVNKRFPGRIPQGTNVNFSLWDIPDEGGTNPNTSSFSRIKEVSVYLPERPWNSRNKDNRLLIDIIDHELVHVGDFASGRAARYSEHWSDKTVYNIMDYRAYSENQWYNQNMREPALRIDYSGKVEYYKALLPAGWWKY